MKDQYKTYMRITCFIIIFPVLFFSIAYANGAKPTEDPTGSGGLIFDENSHIALVKEDITFNIHDNEYDSKARVIVNYEMKNTVDEDQSFDMFFVISPILYDTSPTPYSIYLNDVELINSYPPQYRKMDMPNNWRPKIPAGIVEPYSRKVIDDTLEQDISSNLSSNQDSIYGFDIPMEIKAKSTARLKIIYEYDGGFYKLDEFHNTIYSGLYYMTPASFWEGEPQVSLTLSFPERIHYKIHSNIPLEKSYLNTYTAKLNKLPEHEWVFSFVKTKGLIYGTNSSKVHFYLTLTIALLIYLTGYILARRLHRKDYKVVGYTTALAYFVVFKGKIIDGYIGDTMILMLLFAIFFVIIPFYALIKHGKSI